MAGTRLITSSNQTTRIMAGDVICFHLPDQTISFSRGGSAIQVLFFSDGPGHKDDKREVPFGRTPMFARYQAQFYAAMLGFDIEPVREDRDLATYRFVKPMT